MVVRKGDSVYALSRRHRVGVRSLIDANRLKPPYLLKVGQRLELPKPRDHVVAKGDTLNGISRRYGVGAYALARTNGLKSPYTIRVGQRLRLPDGPAATAAASPPRPAGAGKIASAPLAPPPAKISRRHSAAAEGQRQGVHLAGEGPGAIRVRRQGQGTG